MATREEKIAAVRTAFEGGADFAERLVDALTALQALEPAQPQPETGRQVQVMLWTGLEPVTPEQEQKLQAVQDQLGAIYAEIAAGQALPSR